MKPQKARRATSVTPCYKVPGEYPCDNQIPWLGAVEPQGLSPGHQNIS